MKHSNEDMDDLFRRAAERYPLRTDSADWNRLAGALDGQPALPPDEEEKRRRRGVFWWFLLIPLAGIGYLTYQGRVQHAADKVMTASPGGGAHAAKDGRAAKEGVVAENGGVGDANAGSGTANGGPGAANTGRGVANATARDANAGADGNRTAKAKVAPGVTDARTGGTDANAGTGVGLNSNSKTEKVRTGSANRLLSGRRKVHKLPTIEGKKTNLAESTGVASGAEGRDGSGNFERIQRGFLNLDLRVVPIGSGNQLDIDVPAPRAAVSSTDKTGGKPGPTPPAAKKNPRFYAGVSAAPDFSTVHFQRMKGVGTTFGVLLGYSLNNRWAIETGLYLDRKRYYTDAEYFSTKKVTIPPNYTLLNVDGTCYMWEIPVNVRYNFNTSPRMQWFATTGLSTYLMSRENYTYEVESGWATGFKTWNIHKPSQYWFSIMNLSAGFEQRMGKIGNLRLEPYVRIPLSGIGTGSLPILSGGVNIGLTHRF